jgi:hypothetical protein
MAERWTHGIQAHKWKPSIWTQPLRLPRWKPRRIRLKMAIRTSSLVQTILSLIVLAQSLYLWWWGLQSWRLGTLLISTLILAIFLYRWPEDNPR